ncbi:MAG: trypsin-like serine protease [Gemmatimonadaceae bacterium]
MRQLRQSFATAASSLRRASIALSVAVVGTGSLVANVGDAQELTVGPVVGGDSSPALFRDWVAQKMMVVAGSNFNAALYSTPKGTGYDGVAALYIEHSDGNAYLCSGALLAGGLNVLTAAHCLTNEFGVNITTNVLAVFFTPGAPTTTREFIASSSTMVNPAYTGEVIDAHDVAIVKLSAAPSPGILSSAYSLYMGNPFGQTGRAVGSGATGTGATGETQGGGFSLADRRTGVNAIDFTWADPRFNGEFIGAFGSADPFGLVADFDNGTAAQNTACRLTSLSIFSFGASAPCGGGFGTSEVNLGGGDSGGPLFIGNQIAGVAGYGITFGASFGDTDTELNGTFGELSGWSSTAYNAAWITQATTSVPEPSSFVLLGAGMFAVAGIARRRNRVF